MKLFYKALLTFLLAGLMLSASAQMSCCNAGFTSSHLPQSSGLNVFQFEMNDSAAADIQYVQWSFGDGTYSNSVDPMHSYNYTGSYPVTLTVFKRMIDGVQKSCSETRDLLVESTCSNFIYFQSNRTISFIQTAAFDIDSTSSWVQARTFLWTFGDGQTSNKLNPVHTYAQTGTYTACLYQYRKDSAFVDSCYTCKSFVVQDTVPAVVCNSAFSYALTDSLISLQSNVDMGNSYWWIEGDTNMHAYGNNARFVLPSKTFTVCHRQYMDSIIGPESVYCSECAVIRPPVDSIVICNPDFTYELADTTLTLHSLDATNNSFWWIQGRESLQHYGQNAHFNAPSTGELTVCHRLYTGDYIDSSSQYCEECKTIRNASVDSTYACNSDFDYTVTGNMIVAFALHGDSAVSHKRIWNFYDQGFVYDTLIANQVYSSPGTKKVCLTTFGGSQDSCTTCKDILIESADITIHPNPAVHNINIRSNDGVISSIEIYDINGVNVKSITGVNVNKYIVNVSHLTSGIYYVSTVLTDGRTNKTKIIVQ